jgi:hypothetical protein
MPIAQAKTAAKEAYSKAKELDEKYSIKEKVPPRAPRPRECCAACARLPQSLSRTLLGRHAAPRGGWRGQVSTGLNKGLDKLAGVFDKDKADPRSRSKMRLAPTEAEIRGQQCSTVRSSSQRAGFSGSLPPPMVHRKRSTVGPCWCSAGEGWGGHVCLRNSAGRRVWAGRALLTACGSQGGHKKIGDGK